MRKKELVNLLNERTERIMVLEQRIDTLNQTLDGYRAKEQAILDSLTASQEEARERIATAQKKAEALTTSAQAQADSLLSQARTQADAEVNRAQSEANALLAAAREDCKQIITNAQNEAADYEQAIARYNALLTNLATQMQENAQQFAAFAGSAAIDYTVVGQTNSAAQAAASLPDAQDDPAQVMRNIYTLQNRDIPESVHQEQTQAPVEPEPAHEAPWFAQEQQPVGEEQQPILASEPEQEATPVEKQQPVQEPVAEPAQEEEIPDLAPRPEPEWSPEDEATSAGEWQPEMEPDIGDIPTVSELMPDEPVASADELSLDALLDEIIKAGE